MEAKIVEFRQIVWEFYRAHGRHDLPWRLPQANGEFDPYKILVSEVMLQQTQVARVTPKFEQFIAKFPNTYALAHATLAEVLAVWSGLGYNRRAKFLWQAAQMIERDFDGVFPKQQNTLQKLPGVGANTAGAITAYVFNQPATFVETNVRTVFIHHFFPDQKDIADKAILNLVEATLDASQPRTWFWALMDYGTYLKQTVGNLSRASKTYAKQAPFEGSRRQLRGVVLRALLGRSYSQTELAALISDDRLGSVLTDLVAEGLVRQTEEHFALH